jgi:F-type H+-transporting ATPase subunit epsilon
MILGMEKLIHMKVLLPYSVFLDINDVTRMSIDTDNGSYGFLPNRLDCAAVIVPGILSYETVTAGEMFLAVDEGVMVKTGPEILVSVRNAIGGSDLGKLHEAIQKEFLNLNEEEKNARAVMVKLETNLIKHLSQFQM